MSAPLSALWNDPTARVWLGLFAMAVIAAVCNLLMWGDRR